MFIGAVKRNKLLAKVTASEVENVVKLWLRYANERSGGGGRQGGRRPGHNRDSDSDD